MNFGTNSLCETLEQYRNIIIYGTGNYAQEIYPHLVQGGFKERIICFTQTDECENSLYENIPIINITKLNCNKADCVVLIATSKLYAEEIRQTLIGYQYPHIICLADYVIDYLHNPQAFYLLHTFSEYCIAIADWYIRTHTDKTDQKLLVQELADRGKNAGKRKDSNLIVLISGHLSIRSSKILGALRKKGYQIIILQYSDNKHTWCIGSYEKLDITIYQCQYIEEMLYKALQYDPLIYFFEPHWADCTWAEIMLRNKEYFGKIVLSLYDTLNDGFFAQPQYKCDTERYALENADGVVWKWFSEETLKKRGFHFQGKSILFLDYCGNVDESILHNVETESRVLKLCMVLGVDTLVYKKRTEITEYTSLAKLHEIMDSIGNRDDCVFHLYVGQASEEAMELYRQYEEQYENFKFYINTDRDQLLKKLSHYDYACNIYTKGEIPPDDLIIDDMKGSGIKNYCRNSFFDYLSAGLSIIATMPQRYIEYMQKYDVIIKMDTSTLDVDYLKKNRQYYRRNAEMASKELNIDNQIERLIQFFSEVSYA